MLEKLGVRSTDFWWNTTRHRIFPENDFGRGSVKKVKLGLLSEPRPPPLLTLKVCSKTCKTIYTISIHDSKQSTYYTNLSTYDTNLSTHDTNLSTYDTNLFIYYTNLSTYDIKKKFSNIPTYLHMIATYLTYHPNLYTYDCNISTYYTNLYAYDGNISS